jgi:uncharacterized protein HemX
MNASATPQSKNKNKAAGLIALVIVAFVALGGIFMFIHRARSAPNPIEQRLHAAEQEILTLKKQAQASEQLYKALYGTLAKKGIVPEYRPPAKTPKQPSPR